MSNHSIYISHAWGGESEEIVQEIYKRCRKSGLNILLDKKDLGYRESISSFMKNLGQADAIILVVSNKYLHSEYCMYELLQIYENKNMISRIFPVVLDEVSIAKSTERLELVKYWENETENLESKIRELKNLSYIEGITDDLNLYQKIRNNIANMTRILKDINTLNIKLHKDSDYNHLIRAIEEYILASAPSQNKKQKGSTEKNATIEHKKEVPGSYEIGSDQNTHQSDKTDKKWWTGLFRLWSLVVIAGLGVAVMYGWYSYGPERGKDVDGQLLQNVELNPKEKGAGITDFSEMNTDTPVLPKEDENRTPNASMPKNHTLVNNQTNTPPVTTSDQLSGKTEETGGSASAQTPLETSKSSNSEKESFDVRSHIAQKAGEDTINQEEEVVIDTESSFRMEKVFIPSTRVSVRLPENISSNSVEEGDLVYLQLEKPQIFSGIMISDGNARVRARVVDTKASYQGGRGALGIRLEGLETVDGQWLELDYHDIVERKRGVVIFPKGTILTDVEIKPTTINLKIVQ